MRDPAQDFAFALSWPSGVSIGLYSGTAIAVYCLAGDYTNSPGLVLATGLANAHVGIKYVYVEIMQRMKMTHEITANSVRSWTVWFPCASVFWVLCCVISNAIPIFDSILSITSLHDLCMDGKGCQQPLLAAYEQGDLVPGVEEEGVVLPQCHHHRLGRLSKPCGIVGVHQGALGPV
ncbi:hypothetical protein ACJZ2D_008178 [Fusarium nematophilum]